MCVLKIFISMNFKVLPRWMDAHPDVIKSGSEFLDQLLTVLLSTSMFVGGLIGFVLDNTVPGNYNN